MMSTYILLLGQNYIKLFLISGSMINEGSVSLGIEESSKISRKMGVFYNPVMQVNRDISILVLNALQRDNLIIADPLAGSGVRSIRFIKEVEGIGVVHANDKNPKAVENMHKNCTLNDVSGVQLYNEDANLFLRRCGPFDYIDIDPFGTPNPFLDSAVYALKNNGVLAVTATDTSALSGTYPRACQRKYWARPLRNELMHEVGMRILIRKVQMHGTMHECGLFPVYSFSVNHYLRVFFVKRDGKKMADEVLDNHSYLCFKEDKDFFLGSGETGPLWSGCLRDNQLELNPTGNCSKRTLRLVEVIGSEIDVPFYYDIHKLCKSYKIACNKKRDRIIEELKSGGFRASRTHFSNYAVRTDAKAEEIIRIIL